MSKRPLRSCVRAPAWLLVAAAGLAFAGHGHAASPAPGHEGLVPGGHAEQRLERALERYREVARLGGWRTLPAGRTLRVGDAGPDIAILRGRLAATGDLSGPLRPMLRFDAALDQAVRRFQRRLGLVDDGLVGRDTRAALNVGVDRRIATLAANLSRSRRAERAFGDRYLLINLPAFELFAVAAGRTVLSMRIVIGTRRLATPEFSARITDVVFNPFWVVPSSIARKELLPLIQDDVTVLARRGFRVFDGWDAGARELAPTKVDWSRVTSETMRYRLRQEPGPLNPLGRIKFVLADSNGIHLHDTPSRGAFGQPARALSHGCIRLEHPLDLAAFALEGTGDWSPARVVEAAKLGRRQAVRLARPLAVHTVYRTAWVDRDGTVHFRADIYGHDAKERLKWRGAETGSCAAN